MIYFCRNVQSINFSHFRFFCAFSVSDGLFTSIEFILDALPLYWLCLANTLLLTEFRASEISVERCCCTELEPCDQVDVALPREPADRAFTELVPRVLLVAAGMNRTASGRMPPFGIVAGLRFIQVLLRGGARLIGI